MLYQAYNDSPLVCSGEGVSACGVCVCRPGRFGKNCECSAHGGVSAEQERGCRPTNASAGPLCSNRGTCICGVCECNKMDDPLKVLLTLSLSYLMRLKELLDHQRRSPERSIFRRDCESSATAYRILTQNRSWNRMLFNQ